MKKILIILALIMITTGCRQKEEPRPQYQFPTGPIQAQDDTKLLREAVQKDPRNVNAWIKLGNIFMDTSRCNEAIDAYSKALDIDPKNVDVRVDMGTCYRYTGRSDRAVEEYRKALKIDPDHLYGHKNLAVVLYYDFSDRNGAITEFKKYLELAPNAPDADQVRQEIQKLEAIK
ncbi:MAG: tetratricopeptide repeat protein [Nitrospirota bacterium]